MADTRPFLLQAQNRLFAINMNLLIFLRRKKTRPGFFDIASATCKFCRPFGV